MSGQAHHRGPSKGPLVKRQEEIRRKELRPGIRVSLRISGMPMEGVIDRITSDWYVELSGRDDPVPPFQLSPIS